MNADDPMNEESIFIEALQLKSPEDRAAFLERACAGNPLLRESVERLIRAHERAGNFLGAHAAALSVTVELPVAEQVGATIGPYKLLKQIGEGGFGVVYMAEQHQPIRRRVALKVLKPGMDTHQVIARFEQEREALALMDHPNIAQVLDAGTTDSGRPYFVMELIRGIPVTEYCDERQLSPRQRLELFVPLCQAVQHAHQKGIIHRDIKPTNVLVTQPEGPPLVKVIDFGIAKATGQQLTERTLHTNVAQMIGTPLYMSPEQAELTSQDVDTRTDIYSLGVLLYELLTGTTPFEKQRFAHAAFDEIRRIIREEEPPRPSLRLSSLGDTLPSVSAMRQTEPRKLRQLVRGDLDWIVMKALEKDRARRYETASGMARDVQRFLANEPVEACPPSATYRLRKFARRNRTAAVVTAAFAALLIVAAATSTYFAVAASRRAVESDANAATAQRNERAASRQAQLARQNMDSAIRAIDRMLTRVSEEELINTPHLEPLRRKLLEDALEFHKQLMAQNAGASASSLEVARSLARLARIDNDFARRIDARSNFQQAIALFDEYSRENPLDHQASWDLIECRRQFAYALRDAGDDAGAYEQSQRAVELAERLTRGEAELAEHSSELGGLYSQWSERLLAAGQAEQAEIWLRKAIALTLRNGDHGATGWLLNQLGQMETNRNRFDAAEAALAEARGQFDAALSANPESASARLGSGHTTNLLAEAIAKSGRGDEIEHLLREAAEIYGRLADEFPSFLAYARVAIDAELNVARRLQGQERPESDVWFRKVVARYSALARTVPTDPKYVEGATNVQAARFQQLRQANEHEQAQGVLRELAALLDLLVAGPTSNQPPPESLANCFLTLAGLHYEMFDDNGADRALTQSLRFTDAATNGQLELIARRHAMALQWKWTDWPRVERILRPAIPVVENLVRDHPDQVEYRKCHALVLHTVAETVWNHGDRTESQEILRQAIAAGRIWLGHDPASFEARFHTGGALALLGHFLRMTGRPEEALEPLTEARELLERLCIESHNEGAYRDKLANAYSDLCHALVFAPERIEEAAGVHRLEIALRRERVSELPTILWIRSSLARACWHWGLALKGLGRQEEALAAFCDGASAAQAGYAALGKEPELLAAWADNLFEAAAIEQVLGRDPAGDRQLIHALEEGKDLAKIAASLPPDVRQRQRQVFREWGGRLEWRDWPQAEQAHRVALAFAESLCLEFPGDRGHEDALGNIQFSLATALFWQRKSVDAAEPARQALAYAIRRCDADPTAAELAAVRVERERILGMILTKVARAEEAEEHLRRGLALAEKLSNEHADNLNYALSAAWCHRWLAILLANPRLNRLSEARGHYEQGINILQQLVRENPEVVEYSDELAWGHENWGETLGDFARHEDALPPFAAALKISEELLTRSMPAPSSTLNLIVHILLARARCLNELNRFEDAAADYRRVVEVSERHAKIIPQTAQLITAWRGLARIAAEQGRTAMVAEACHKLLEINPRDAKTLNDLAWLLATSEDTELRNPARAIELATRAVELDPEGQGFRNTLGLSHYRAGNWQKCVDELHRSAEQSGGTAFDGFFLAMAYWRLGDKEQAWAWYDKSLDRMAKHGAADEELVRFRAEAQALLKPATQPDKPANP